MVRGLVLAGALFILGAALATDSLACGPKGRHHARHQGMMQTAMPRGGSPPQSGRSPDPP